MKPRAIAAVWIAGATVPLFIATIFLFGCCVLPFHQVLHKLMPLCDMAGHVMRGHHADADQSGGASVPAQEKEQPVKRLVTSVPGVFRLAAMPASRSVGAPAAATAYRSFIAQGALRCDQDVGLNLLDETFRI